MKRGKAMTRTVTVKDLTTTLAIDIAYGEEFQDQPFLSSEVSRPGLVLVGFTENYAPERVQLLGRTEMSYINTKSEEEQKRLFENICSLETPAIIIARGMEVPETLIPVAQTSRTPILTARAKTSRVLANVANFLETFIAERFSKHGVFLEVYGMGVLLIGASGVGKSETALELVQRGHRLVADDRVELYQIDELTLMGEAPDILQNLLEIRGLGIINVMTLFGVRAVSRKHRLDLIIDLRKDDGTIEYDRLGYDHEYEKIFEVQVPTIKIPVKTGRNLAVIIESAAMNFRASELGFDARREFSRRLDLLIQSNSTRKEDDSSGSNDN